MVLSLNTVTFKEVFSWKSGRVEMSNSFTLGIFKQYKRIKFSIELVQTSIPEKKDGVGFPSSSKENG